MRKINILYIITQLELGGAQKQALSLIRGIDRTRYNLFLVTAKEGFLMEEALSISGLTLCRSKYLGRAIHPLKDFWTIFEIAGFIKCNKIDIVHTHSSKAGVLGRWAAALSGVKVIIHTVHGWSFNDFQGFLARNLYRGLERFCSRFTDKIIVVSHHDKRKGVKRRIGDEVRYQLVRYGIERTLFGVRDASIRKELGIRADALVVGAIACFKPQKAPEDFVELASKIHQKFPSVIFLMVGDGALRGAIESLIARHQLGSQFILTGWRKDIPGILSVMDVFVLTSLWEGLPIAVLEAMVTQVPVVATHTGGVSEVVVENETGFLVPCHDLSSMLKKVNALLEDGPLRARIGLNAKKKIGEVFSVESMVKAHDDLYQRLIKEKGVFRAC